MMNNSSNVKQLKIPQIPRREEAALIQDAIDNIDGGVQVIFIGGASGTGKSTLLSTALEAATFKGASKARQFQYLQASTKFDQKRACAPLSGLRRLVSELVVASTQTHGHKLRNSISIDQYKVLQSFMTTQHAQSTRKFIMPKSSRQFSKLKALTEEDNSEFEGMSEITESTSDQDSMDSSIKGKVNKDGRTILTTTLKAVLRAISSITAVILTLEDLHWSCSITLEVLQKIVTDERLTNVLICATYRTDDPGATDGFYEWRDNLETGVIAVGLTVSTINIGNLELPVVQELLAEAVSQEVSQVTDLAETVYSFTLGNVYFLKLFLASLQENELLTFDPMQYRWVWNAQTIRMHGSLSNNVVEILVARIHKLSEPVRNILLLASCFGAHFDARALEAAKSVLGIDSAHQRLAEAQEFELVVQIHDSVDGPDNSSTHYKFAHDTIQAAAYGMFPKDKDLAQLHWDIGCLLMQNDQLMENDCILFATVDHLNTKALSDQAWLSKQDSFVADLPFQMASTHGRIQLAEMNYMAGCKASKLSAFGPAALYIEAGIAALGEHPFEHFHELACKLFTMAAQTHYVMGKLDASQLAALQVLDHAKTYEVKMPLLMVMFDCHQARSNPAKLLEFALKALQELGESKLEENPNKLRVIWEYKKMKVQLRGLTSGQILNLPSMNDSKQEAVLRLMYKLIFPLYQMQKQRLCSLIICRMISITLTYGLSKTLAPQCFVMAATLVISQDQDIEEGYRLGKTAQSIIGQQGFDPHDSTVLAYLAHLNSWWREPVPMCLDSFLVCNRVAMKAGDVGNAFQSTVGYGVTYFYSGLPIGPLLEDMKNFGSLYLEYNQIMFFLLATPLWQCCLNLTGKSTNPSSMKDGVIMERRKAFPNHEKCGAESIQSFQMLISFYMGDLEMATTMAEKLVDCKPGIMGASFWYHSRLFLLGLVAIANYRLTGKRNYKMDAEKQLTHFKKVVKKGAINLVHKLQLLQAEMMTAEVDVRKSPKKADSIIAMYDSAIVCASRAGCLQDAALANYLCFQFCKENKIRGHLLELYLKKSLEQWIAWGAMAVADSIIDRNQDMFDTLSAMDTVREMKDSSMSSSVRSRPRFEASLAMQHKELKF